MKVFRILFMASFLAIPFYSLAQIVIDESDMPSIGTGSLDYSTIGDQSLSIGPGGVNQIWTIPDYEWETGTPTMLMEASASAYASYFPTATHCFAEDTTDDEWVLLYWRLSASGLNLTGLVNKDEGDEPIIGVLDNELVFFQLPMTYGTAWTTVASFSVEVLPGIFVMHRDSVINVIDGWGTLNTPFGSWESLRLKEHRFSMRLIPGQPPEIEQRYTYQWITELPFTGANMEPVEGDTSEIFTFGHVSISQTITSDMTPLRGPIAENFSVGQNYPNPFNPTTALPIYLEKAGNVEITIYNELGEVVSSEIRTFGAGNHTVGFDGSAWASGNYFARVKAGGQLQTMRMILVK
ncbi:T9SS type A sorting domain-containing protein [bacterium]|nr:T9SS type A sorting domain-containing protein [bacterium]